MYGWKIDSLGWFLRVFLWDYWWYIILDIGTKKFSRESRFQGGLGVKKLASKQGTQALH